MFGHAYYGITYFSPTYFGPLPGVIPPPKPPEPPVIVHGGAGRGRGWRRWPSVPAWINPFALLYRKVREEREELEELIEEEDLEGVALLRARFLVHQYELREAALKKQAAQAERFRLRRRLDEELLLGIKEDGSDAGWHL